MDCSKSGTALARKYRTRGAEAAERGPLPCPEQDAGQFAGLVENRAARVALAGFDVELDHFVWEIDSRRKIIGAVAGGDAVLAAAVAVDREQVALARRLGGDFYGFDVRAPDHEGGQVPIGVDFERLGVRAEAVGEDDFDETRAVADDVPIGDHQAVVFVHADQRAAAEGGRAVFGNDDSGDGGMGRYVSGGGVVDGFAIVGAKMARRRAGCRHPVVARAAGAISKRTTMASNGVTEHAVSLDISTKPTANRRLGNRNLVTCERSTCVWTVVVSTRPLRCRGSFVSSRARTCVAFPGTGLRWQRCNASWPSSMRTFVATRPAQAREQFHDRVCAGFRVLMTEHCESPFR